MIDLKRRAMLRSLSTLAGASILAPVAGPANNSSLPQIPSERRSTGVEPSPSSRDTFSAAAMRESVSRTAGLIPDLTFETLASGKANQRALAAAKQTVDNQDSPFNPLLLYGADGAGKGHMMNAIGNRILERNPRAQVQYVHTENFIAIARRAAINGDLDNFMRKYESLDALLIDDVRYFCGESFSQEKLLRIFDLLENRGSLIVMADTLRPKDWFGNFDREFMDRHLFFILAKSRAFELGSADLALRVSALRAIALRNGIALDDETNRFIAQRVQSRGLRELEVDLVGIYLYARYFKGQNVSLSLAQDYFFRLKSLA